MSHAGQAYSTAATASNPRQQYRDEYLRSPHWQTVRMAALERAAHRCQVCNSKGQLDVHHRTYERLGSERDADLTVLCRRCHDLFHDNAKVVRAKAPKKPRPPRQESAAKRQRREAREARADRIVQTLRIGGYGDTHMLASRSGLKLQLTGESLSELRKQGVVRRDKGGNWHLL